jgi:hypothetical protein
VFNVVDRFSRSYQAHWFQPFRVPHVPHGWDAGVVFEELEKTLFCSDLFHKWGHREPATKDDILERSHDALRETEAGPFANYVPYTHHTGRVLESLAEREPKTLAIMHGSSYYGNAAHALRDLATVMREVLGPKEQEGETTSGGLIKAWTGGTDLPWARSTTVKIVPASVLRKLEQTYFYGVWPVSVEWFQLGSLTNE